MIKDAGDIKDVKPEALSRLQKTLPNLLTFIFLYTGLVFEPLDTRTEKEKNMISEDKKFANYLKNRNNKKMIDMLPILT